MVVVATQAFIVAWPYLTPNLNCTLEQNMSLSFKPQYAYDKQISLTFLSKTYCPRFSTKPIIQASSSIINNGVF
jgi:hypothetical protein